VSTSAAEEIATAAETPTFGEAVGIWAKIGLLSFGGPAGQIALMHRIVVDEKRWVTEDQFLHALNFCMLLPGPEAQQLAVYVGWLLHKIRGGLVAGILFILPGFFVILGLSYLYVLAGELTIVQGLFLGLKGAVIAIVMQAVMRIGRRALKSTFLLALAILSFLGMFAFSISFPIIIASAALIGLAASKLNEEKKTPRERLAPPPSSDGWRRSGVLLGFFALLWFGPTVALYFGAGPTNVFTDIAIFFSKMAVITFGGAYAVLSYVAQEAVQSFGWLNAREMIDGLAMAETTPGPLIITVQFVGFMAAYRDPGMLPPAIAGFFGSVLTVWVTFTPCFLWVFLGAPFVETMRENVLLKGAFTAVTAAVVGAVANLAAWFTFHALFQHVGVFTSGPVSTVMPEWSSLNLVSLAITICAMIMTFGLRMPILAILGVAGALGIILSGL